MCIRDRVYKIKRRPVDVIASDKTQAYQEKLKSSGLKGWTMCEFSEALDSSGSFINGFSIKKDGQVAVRTIYAMDTIVEMLFALYDKIVEMLAHGHIAIEPDKDACLFCHFHDICRFQGSFRDPKPMMEAPDSLYLKGGKRNEME